MRLRVVAECSCGARWLASGAQWVAFGSSRLECPQCGATAYDAMPVFVPGDNGEATRATSYTMTDAQSSHGR